MRRIAKFSKVSFEQYLKDFKKMFPHTQMSDEEIRKQYDAIKLPTRATGCSAGYDFFLPHSFTFSPNYNTFFPTGICCTIEEDWVLQLYPKSGLGTKYGTRLVNTIGIVDAR